MKKICLSKLIKNIKEIIVEDYIDNISFKNYKHIWQNRIFAVAEKYNILLIKKTQSWEEIEDAVCKKSKQSTSIESSSQSTASHDSSSSNLSYKLTKHDKDYIKEIYEGLNSQKMWTLSTGTVVEMKMAELAKECVYEHPCHSLILDTDDETWGGYFTQEELEEIQAHKAKPLKPVPSELFEYLNNITQDENIETMHERIARTYYSPKKNSSCYWAQKSLLDGLDLHMSGFFKSFIEHSERDYLSRVWRLVLTVFDSSVITAREEICSKASSFESNRGQQIASVTNIGRKKSAKRPDHIFRYGSFELGISEAAKVSDENGDKDIKDSRIKAPKLMKDLMQKILENKPGLINTLRIPSIIMSGK
ncbi:hypothetical protein J3Q64DRAFT_1677398 [Phycomyces blakesleeanus]|uniref:RGS domain-containing protein n=1 Tax=Phycomyces blakesleeanus TaxID=4837 RepID=A0ABR3AZX7_PHYBL